MLLAVVRGGWVGPPPKFTGKNIVSKAGFLLLIYHIRQGQTCTHMLLCFPKEDSESIFIKVKCYTYSRMVNINVRNTKV